MLFLPRIFLGHCFAPIPAPHSFPASAFPGRPSTNLLCALLTFWLALLYEPLRVPSVPAQRIARRRSPLARLAPQNTCVTQPAIRVDLDAGISAHLSPVSGR